MKKFKICWKSKITGFEGEGNPAFKTKEDAIRKIEFVEKEYPEIHHWVEEVDMSGSHVSDNEKKQDK